MGLVKMHVEDEVVKMHVEDDGCRDRRTKQRQHVCVCVCVFNGWSEFCGGVMGGVEYVCDKKGRVCALAQSLFILSLFPQTNSALMTLVVGVECVCEKKGRECAHRSRVCSTDGGDRT